MDNKYALGGTRVAHEHHDARIKSTHPPAQCRFCDCPHLVYCSTMNDHLCDGCGEYQEDTPQGYPTGRSADY